MIHSLLLDNLQLPPLELNLLIIWFLVKLIIQSGFISYWQIFYVALMIFLLQGKQDYFSRQVQDQNTFLWLLQFISLQIFWHHLIKI